MIRAHLYSNGELYSGNEELIERWQSDSNAFIWVDLTENPNPHFSRLIVGKSKPSSKKYDIEIPFPQRDLHLRSVLGHRDEQAITVLQGRNGLAAGVPAVS